MVFDNWVSQEPFAAKKILHSTWSKITNKISLILHGMYIEAFTYAVSYVSSAVLEEILTSQNWKEKKSAIKSHFLKSNYPKTK